MRTSCTVEELHSGIRMAMTPSKNPLIAETYLMDDMFPDKCIDDTIECRGIHLFGSEKSLFELTKGETLFLLESPEDMTTMDSREHKKYRKSKYFLLILCIFLQMQIFLK